MTLGRIVAEYKCSYYY